MNKNLLFLLICVLLSLGVKGQTVSATAGACSGTTNKYTLSGSVTWASMPSTGQMIISIPGEGTVIKNAPFTSPVAYSMNYLNSDGTSKTVNVTFTASAATASTTYTAPAACIAPTCASGTVGSETFTYTIPLSYSDLTDVAVPLPKFNTMGGTRTLQKVLMTQKNGFIANVLTENMAATASTAKAFATIDAYLQWGDYATGTTLVNTLLSQTNENHNYPAGIVVSAGGTPGYTGDVLMPPALTVYSTLKGMEAYTPNWHNNLSTFTDPTLGTNWVTNLTGNASDDDDIFYNPGYLINQSNSSIVTTSLSSYSGSGNLPITVSTFSGFGISGGGGNIFVTTTAKYSVTVSVTYYYCSSLSATAGTCSGTDNTYSVSGSITLPSGYPTTLPVTILIDGEASVTLNPPLSTSAISFTLNGLNSDGLSKKITAYYPDALSYLFDTVNYTSPVACFTVPSCTAPSIAGSEVYTYSTPVNEQNAGPYSLSIPKFNTMGGIRTLQKVLVTTQTKSHTTAICEAGSMSAGGTGTQSTIVGEDFTLNGTSIINYTTTETRARTWHSGINNVASGTWPGESFVSASLGYFTLTVPSAASLIMSSVSGNFDVQAHPSWVTNAISPTDPAADDDIAFMQHRRADATRNLIVSSGFTNYIGSGNLLLLSNPTCSQATLGVSGQLSGTFGEQSTKVTVKYYYCAVAAPTVTSSASACSGTNNTYSVSGTITGTLPTTGTLIASVSGEGSQFFDLSAGSYSSPLSYTITGLNASGGTKTVNFIFSDAPILNTSTTYSAPTACVTSSCSLPLVLQSESYTSTVPLMSLGISNYPLTIPKFNNMGGTRLLQKVLITRKSTSQFVGNTEHVSTASTGDELTVTQGSTGVIKVSGTNVLTGDITNNWEPRPLVSAVLVPASGAWLGDVAAGLVMSTRNRMNLSGLDINSFTVDPRLSSLWVSNITGNAGDDDDIYYYHPTTRYRSDNVIISSGFTNYEGSGNVPLTYTSQSSLSTSGTSNLLSQFNARGSAEVTITYFYCSVPLASLGNKVWRDDDKDGIQDAGEPGVAGVSVTLYKGTSVIGTTTTDAYGNYLFSNLAPGTDYSIKVTPPANYSFTTQGTPGASGAGTATDCDVDASGISDAINLTSGMNQLDVDAGLIFTAPTLSSIGDKVWLDADADGVQDAGENGVSGVTVTLYKETSSGSGVYVPYMTTTTNGSGNYLFNNLPNNTNYKVGVTPLPNTKLTSSTGTTTGAATTNSDVDPSTRISGVINVPLAGANYTGIDAGLISDTKSSLGDRMWNDVNNNGIQDAGEQGIPGVVMTLYKETSVGSGTYTSIATTTTDANGKYIFTDLDPAKYKVSATLPSGYSVSSVDAGTDDFADNDFSVTATPTSGEYDLLANQDYAGVDYGIHNSTSGLGSIGDKVWLDTDADGVQDLGEIGQAGITVRLLDGSGNPVNNPATGMPYVLVTDANGNYKFVDLPAGTYKVSFSNLPVNTQFSPTGAGTTSTDNDADASGTTAAITLSSGANITDIDAGISPYAASGLGSIGDRVWVDANNDGIQNSGEQGIGGVTVTLYQSDGTTVIATTTTNPSGGYSFDGLSAGNYVVGFSGFPSGYALQSGKNDLGGNDLLDSDPNPTTGKTAIISLGSGEDNTSVDAGIYNTTATNSIGDKVWIDTNNDGLQTTGEPSLSGITVNLINSSGVIVSSVLTDANGNYSFKNLPNGDYLVKVSLPTGLSFTTQNQGTLAQIDSNSKVFPTFGTTPWVTLSGGTNVINLDAGLVTTKALLGDRVWNDVDGNGIQDLGESGIAGVTVTLYASDGTTVITSTVTDANGNYLFTNLDAGNYIVGFSTIPNGLGFSPKNASGSTAANGSDASVTTGKTDVITLAAGDINMNVDAGLTPVLLGGISGVVWFDGLVGDFNRGLSEPLIPGVTVTLKDNLGNIVGTTLSDGTGAYKFTNLPEGTGYTVTFSNYSGTLVPQTTGTATGSDPNPSTGITPSITVIGGAITPNIDAGFDIFAPLPVTLVKFGATSQQCKVFINWETGVESMVKQYVVRRSSNGVNYTTVASINPKGSNSTYSVEDVKPNKGDNYYRLDIVDISSSITVSPVAKVNVNCAQAVSINVYPNPTTGLVNISGLSGSPTIVKVLNLQGQVIKTINTTNTNETIDLKAFPSANYMLQVLENDIIKLNVTVERL